MSLPPNEGPRRGWSVTAVTGYYLATPLFAAVDLAIGLNVRTTFFEQVPVLKWVYYLIAFGCGVAIWLRPRFAAIVGLAESSANIALLVLAVMIGYLRLLESAGAESASPAAPPLDAEAVVHLLVSATMLAVSYITSQARVAREIAGPR